jgi:predicted PurR-regulated permease PerM
MNAEVAGGRRLLLAILLAGMALLCLLILEPFITPIVWAAILAYASWPLYARLKRVMHALETLPALLMTLIVGCAVVLPVLWILVVVRGELINAYQQLAAWLAEGPHRLPAFIGNIPSVGQKLQDTFDQYAADPAALGKGLGEWMLRWAGQLSGILGGVGRNVVTLSLTLLTLFYFYRDGKTILAQAHQVIRGFFGERLDPYVIVAGRMTRAVVYGMLVSAFGQGLVAGIGYWVLGLGGPVLLGVLTAVLSVVPLLGSAIVWVPVGIWLLASGHLLKAIIMLLWGALLVYPVDNVLRPVLISNATRVPFLVVMFGALGGLSEFGLLGLFVGPVLLAVAMAIWREWSVHATTP